MDKILIDNRSKNLDEKKLILLKIMKKNFQKLQKTCKKNLKSQSIKNLSTLTDIKKNQKARATTPR